MKRTAHASIGKTPSHKPGAFSLDDFDLIDVEGIGWEATTVNGKIKLTKPSGKHGPVLLVTKRALYLDYKVSLLAEIFPGEIGVVGNFYSPEDLCASSVITTVGEDNELYVANSLYQLRGNRKQGHLSTKINAYKYRITLEVLEDIMSSDGKNFYDIIEQVKGRSHVGIYVAPSNKLKGNSLILGPFTVEDLGA